MNACFYFIDSANGNGSEVYTKNIALKCFNCKTLSTSANVLLNTGFWESLMFYLQRNINRHKVVCMYIY